LPPSSTRFLPLRGQIKRPPRRINAPESPHDALRLRVTLSSLGLLPHDDLLAHVPRLSNKPLQIEAGLVARDMRRLIWGCANTNGAASSAFPARDASSSVFMMLLMAIRMMAPRVLSPVMLLRDVARSPVPGRSCCSVATPSFLRRQQGSLGRTKAAQSAQSGAGP
jgi:hypothetical protein